MGCKKYCIFAAQYFPHLGGVERYTYNLAKTLMSNGNKVVVVTSNVYNLKEYENMDGIPVYRLPCWNLLDGRYPILKPGKKTAKIYRILRQQKFDMVIVNTRFYFHSLFGMVFARRQKIKCITLDHGTSHLSVHSKFWDFVGGVFEHALTKVDRIFCKDYYGVSLACNEWLSHFHIKARGVLYNSIDLQQIRDMLSEESISYRQKYNIPKNADMEEEIQRRKGRYIIPLGRIDFENIVALLKETDIFCLPSFSEGFSTSILEAAACGCYIVTTARGGAKELLINEEYGCVIPNNQEDILYHALIEAIDNNERREKGIQLTYARIERKFTWDIVAAQVEKICGEN